MTGISSYSADRREDLEAGRRNVLHPSRLLARDQLPPDLSLGGPCWDLLCVGLRT